MSCLFLGCSGLLGLYTEFGPWRAGSNLTLIRNPFTWVKHANIVFLEQPVGVGFSYSTETISRTGNRLGFFISVVYLVIKDRRQNAASVPAGILAIKSR